jgi:hypothetical protein
MATATTPATTLSIAPTTTLSDLRAIVEQLRAEHPNAGARLDHAAFIATFREVEQGANPGTWWVQSETDPAQQYMVTAGQRCVCQDFARRGELTWCKHLISLAIVERAERLSVDRDQLAALPIAWELTEAAYAALDQLGEVPDLEPQRPVGTCTRYGPRSETARAAYRELYDEDPDDDPTA